MLDRLLSHASRLRLWKGAKGTCSDHTVWLTVVAMINYIMTRSIRHDLHNALCICFVLYADSGRVASWLEQLLVTIKSSKSGRITHRSRLRLLIASYFLMADPQKMVEFSDTVQTELQLFQLLGESEVLRLPYSATSLQLTFRDAESLCKTLWRDSKSASTSGVLELLR